ncbi:decarboxylase [Candidatus Woesearchaeota archaeon]|nr:decarboxylase [Candidatus Woesearchaeota archaeon]
MIQKARFILSRKKVLEQYKKSLELCDAVSYSFKTNPDVGKVLEKETDCMFCIHSFENLMQLDDGKRTWFFAQAWNKEELGRLFDRGVNKFVIDNEKDLDVLLKYISEKNKKIDLLLRMRLKEHTIQTGKHFVYGMYSSRINELIPVLKRNKSIGKLGLHFHRKTQNVSEWSLKEELEDTIQHWEKIDLVNIGGGMPAEYKNYSATVLDSIFDKIRELRKWLNQKGIKMIMEPGRFIAASPVKLETHIKSIYDNNIIVDCSVYNAAMDTFVANIRLLVENELEDGEAYTIKGCSPDSMDIFRYRVYLKKPKQGDKLVFLNSGAYNFSSGYFNLQKVETVVVD